MQHLAATSSVPLPLTLQARAPKSGMQLELFDAVGLGAGGSGAAAGLLHPFTPKGKVGRYVPVSHSSPEHAGVLS